MGRLPYKYVLYLLKPQGYRPCMTKLPWRHMCYICLKPGDIPYMKWFVGAGYHGDICYICLKPGDIPYMMWFVVAGYHGETCYICLKPDDSPHMMRFVVAVTMETHVIYAWSLTIAHTWGLLGLASMETHVLYMLEAWRYAIHDEVCWGSGHLLHLGIEAVKSLFPQYWVVCVIITVIRLLKPSSHNLYPIHIVFILYKSLKRI